MFKVTRIKSWIILAFMVCATFTPQLVIADGIGYPDPPLEDPPLIEESQQEGSSQELSDLEILALSIYIYLT